MIKKEDWIKIGVWVGVATVVGVAGHYLLKEKQVDNNLERSVSSESKAKKKEEKLMIKNIVEPKTIIIKNKSSTFPVEIGDSGDHIRQIQANLLKHHGWADVEMGIYDTLTDERVKRFWKVKEITEAIYKSRISNPVKLR